MNRPNVYFAAKAGSGKTFCCEYLKKKYGYKQAKFAYPVYMIAEKYFEMKKKDRNLLQIIGSDVGRDKIDYDLWVNRFQEDMNIVEEVAKLNGVEVNLVSDDCRFPNEHRALYELGWVGIYLNVPDEVRIERLKSRDGDAQVNTLNHSSELALDEFKDELIQIDANCSVEEMYKRIDEVIFK